MIHLIGTVALVAGGVAASLFVLLYHLSARWWRSEEGWHLMAFTACLALTLDYSSWRNLTTTPRPLPVTVEAIRAVIFCAVGGLLVWRLWMLWRIQIRPGLRHNGERER